MTEQVAFAKPLTEPEKAAARRFLEKIESKAPAPRVVAKKERGKVTLGPPGDVDHHVWSMLLSQAFGTTDHAFASLLHCQLVNAAGVGREGSIETHDGILSAMHHLAPRDEAEGMLMAQMVATNAAAMDLLRRVRTAEHLPQFESAGNMATKMLRTYTAQLEALRRYRSGGEQRVTVQHINVTADKAAVQVNGRGVGDAEKTAERARAAITHDTIEPLAPLRCQDQEREAVLVAGGEG